MLSVAQCALPVLRALCDKSLLNHTPSGRYTVHELLRQFAEGKLRAMAHEFEDVQALHCAYYVEFVYAREDALNDARQNEARREIAAEMGNIRAAWSWAVARKQTRTLRPALEGLRLFLDHTGWYTEAIAMFEAAAGTVRSEAGDDQLLHGQLLARQAWFHHRRDQFDEAQLLIQHGLKILRAAQPPLRAEEALCLQCLANMARAVGDFDLSIEYAGQALALYRVVGNPRPIAASLNSLAVAYAERGRLEDARRLHEECLEIRRAMGDRRGVATVLVNLAFAALARENYAQVKPLVREALTIFREIGYPMGEAVALNNLGVAYHMLGEYDDARELLNQCLTLSQELGHRHITAHALSSLAGVAVWRLRLGVATDARGAADGAQDRLGVSDAVRAGQCSQAAV